MAVIVVENGTIVPGANSYITEAELQTYADDRGVTIAGADKAILLIEAMDYIESLAYKGQKFTRDQALVWPRVGVVVDLFLIDSDEIPLLLKDGLAETALSIDRSESPIADIERTKQSISAGSVSVTFASNSASTTIIRKLNTKLHKLLTSGLSGISFKVGKG